MSQLEQQAASRGPEMAEVLPQDALPPPRVVAPVPEAASRWERYVHAVLEPMANAVVRRPGGERLRFGLVKTPEEFAAVGRMRLKVYREKLPYLLQELSADGLDAYDARSFVFAAWRGAQVVATLRATRYPFETLNYVPEPQLSHWLGDGWSTHSLEWGRLAADTPQGFSRLSPAMFSYAGPYLACLTPYRKCFGYSRPEVHRAFSGFRGEKNPLRFKIPHRGEHEYVLVKTEFVRGSLLATPRWLGSLALGLLRPARDTRRSTQPSHP